MTAFALAGKWPGFGASGLTAAEAESAKPSAPQQTGEGEQPGAAAGAAEELASRGKNGMGWGEDFWDLVHGDRLVASFREVKNPLPLGEGRVRGILGGNAPSPPAPLPKGEGRELIHVNELVQTHQRLAEVGEAGFASVFLAGLLVGSGLLLDER